MVEKGRYTGEKNPFFGKKHSEIARQKMRNAWKKRAPVSEETRKKMSEAHKYRSPATDETRRKLSIVKSGRNNPMYGKTTSDKQKQGVIERNKNNKWALGCKHSEETKRKYSQMRIGNTYMKDAIKNGYKIMSPPPNYNPRACAWFYLFDLKHCTSGEYATNGGEHSISELGYWVDYYNPDLKLIMEWDEEHHYVGNKLKQQDVERQKEIQAFHPDFHIVRLREKDIFN